MSASNANKAAAPRQVTCTTADNDQVPVDLDVLRPSGTFKQMYDDLDLQEHDKFPGFFPVMVANTRTFKKVIRWCREHKDDPEPVVEKDPFTQEVKWFELTESERRFFEMPVPKLLELIKAADFLHIPGLYEYACQAVAARIKGKSPSEICALLQQNCDLHPSQSAKIKSPWLSSAFSGARIKNTIFIPTQDLLTIFAKLPREDLERLQLVSKRFNRVIVNNAELSEREGPLRVVTKVEFGAHSPSRFIDVWLPDGTKVTWPDHKHLPRRLKFAAVQNLRLDGAYEADMRVLRAMLPVKSAWKNGTVEAHTRCFPSRELFEFAFKDLLLCKEIILSGERQQLSGSWMRLAAVAACNKLDIRKLDFHGIGPDDVVEWLKREVPPQKKWREPKQIMIRDYGFIGFVDGLRAALETAFSTSSSPAPYTVHVRRDRWYNVVEVLVNKDA